MDIRRDVPTTSYPALLLPEGLIRNPHAALPNGPPARPAPPETVRQWQDIGFTVAARAHNHYLDFEAYDTTFANQGVVYHTPSMTPTDDRAEAEVFLSGSIKWDGCANVFFDAQEDACLHFCGRADAMRVGALLGRLYDLAAELVERWDAECAA
jgi:hypothetical protein